MPPEPLHKRLWATGMLLLSAPWMVCVAQSTVHGTSGVDTDFTVSTRKLAPIAPRHSRTLATSGPRHVLSHQAPLCS